MQRLFLGGTHPALHKETTRRKPAAELDRPAKEVYLALEGQKPLVKAGERVLLGQKVAEPGTEEDAAVHASVSGTVKEAGERGILLENDGKDTPYKGNRPWDEKEPMTARALAAFLREMGVMGMAAGDGASLHKKLIEAAAAPVDTLIINGMECDPWHTADHRLMLEESEAVAGGACILAEALGLPKAILAVAGDKMDAVDALEGIADGNERLEVQVLRSRYPLGEERILTQALTGRKVPPDGKPAAVKCAVFNVATASAVYDAVKNGNPVTHRIVTVTGTAVVKPRNLLVPIGTSVEELVRSCGGLKKGAIRGYWGNPMRFPKLSDAGENVGKSSAAIVLMRGKDVPKRKEGRTCIRCGACVEACPMKLLPLFAETGEEGERGDCVGCGACENACPAVLPLREKMHGRKGEAR